MTMIIEEKTGHGPRLSGKRFGVTTVFCSFRTGFIAFLVVLLAIRLALMVWLPFTDTTEARYAEMARKMVETGNWITPQFDYGVPFWGKPPLHSWASALGMKLFGVGPVGARVFILVASLGVFALMLVWAKEQRRSACGLAAISVCASSLLFFGASAFVMTDMVMVLGTTLAMVAFFQVATSSGHRALWGHLFFVGLAIGMLAKGPTAVVITGIPVFLWVVGGRRWRVLRAVPWVTGGAVWVALTAPWYIAAELQTPGFLHYFLVGEHIERFLVPGWQGDLYGSGHKEAKGMIWLFAIGAFLPWALFTPAFLTRIQGVRNAVRAQSNGWYSYLLFWSLSPLLLFTPAANILPSYVLPAIPAMSLLLVALWSDVFGFNGVWTRRMAALSMIGVTATFAATTLAVHLNPDLFRLRSMATLVAEADAASPRANLFIFPARSYSAEFYSRGRAITLFTPAELQALATTPAQDALIVPVEQSTLVAGVLGPRFNRQASTARYTLFVEKVQ